MNSKGRFVSAFYLAPMFQPGWVASRWYNEIPERIRESSLYMFRVSHTIEVICFYPVFIFSTSLKCRMTISEKYQWTDYSRPDWPFERITKVRGQKSQVKLQFTRRYAHACRGESDRIRSTSIFSPHSISRELLYPIIP